MAALNQTQRKTKRKETGKQNNEISESECDKLKARGARHAGTEFYRRCIRKYNNVFLKFGISDDNMILSHLNKSI